MDLQLTKRNHPSIHTDDHVDTFEDFRNDMLIAGKRHRTRKPRYSQVQVLLLTWKEDDLEEDEKVIRLNKIIEEEVRTVHKLFEATLNFSVERFEIPSVDQRTKKLVNSQNKLLAKITSFVDKYEDDETLLVIYYNGHGSYWGNSCYWHPTEEASELHSGFNPTHDYRGPSLEWNPVQNSISTEADVLIILDCCYAGASLIGTKGPRTTTQILTACGKAQKTPAGPSSFTMRFVRAINDLLATKSKFPVTELYSYILSSTLKPDPLHVIRGAGSIIIEPQPRKDTAYDNTFLVPSTNEHGSPRSSTFVADQNSQFSPHLSPHTGALTDPSSVSSTGSRRVALIVRLKEDVQPNAANWERVLDALPRDEVDGLEDVRIEAAFPTDSTLLIVSMPISIWLLLPPNPAYKFLGFIRGHNVVVPKEHNPMSSEIAPPARIDSDTISFENKGESDVLRQILAAMRDFFEKTKSHEFVSSHRAGKFSQIATKIGLHSKLESDPRYYLVRHIVQQLKVEQTEDGEYNGLSYDLHFTEQPMVEIAKLFESAKKTVKETIHRYSPTNNELEATMTTELDQLENKVLTKLEPEKKSKGSMVLTDRKASADHAKLLANAHPLANAHVRSRSNVSKMPGFDKSIPEEGERVVSTWDASKKRGLRTDSIKSPRKDAKAESLKEKQAPKRTDSGFGSVRPRLSAWRRKGSAVTVPEVKGGETEKHAADRIATNRFP